VDPLPSKIAFVAEGLKNRHTFRQGDEGTDAPCLC